MTKISAQVVVDSICNGHRITTYLLTYPRFIHSEMCRHRMHSRNTASSRAIPPEKMIEAIINDPVIPIAWQKQHKGMQGTEYITDPSAIQWEIEDWLNDRDWAVGKARTRLQRGITKQLVNRPLEPWMWTVELVTATEWENFFALRCPQYVLPARPNMTFRSWKDLVKYAVGELRYNRDVIEGMEATTILERLQQNEGQAEIHMMALAEAMWDARNESAPKELRPGQWHIPFYTDELWKDITTNGMWWQASHEEQEQLLIKVATARAARTSYTVVGQETTKVPCSVCDGTGKVQQTDIDWDTCRHCDGKGWVPGPPQYDYRKDIELHDRLLASGHMSPFEHCAQSMTNEEYMQYAKSVPYPGVQHMSEHEYGWCHNLRGWKSYRSMIPNENRR